MNRVDEQSIEKLIDTIGPQELLSIIDEYNKKVIDNFEIRKKNYLDDRKNITDDIHDLFISTIGIIDEYYRGTERIKDNDELENYIQVFLQSKSLEEQIESAKIIQRMLKKDIKIQEESTDLNKLL